MRSIALLLSSLFLLSCNNDPVVLTGGAGSMDVASGDVGQDVPGQDPDTASTCRIPPAPDLSPLKVERAFGNLSFVQPVYVTNAGDGSGRLFVVEKQGVIHAIDSGGRAEVFIDIRDRVFARGGNDERGLLGLAFEPDFRESGFFWVNYTSQGPGTPTRVSRFKVSEANREVGDPGSEVVAFELAQPFGNHNGGMVEFGPDGMLYIAVGDGGSAGDPLSHGQDLQSFFATILRIDVRELTPDGQYRIPADNPFAGGPGLGEIWAYGLRNVWRFSFDRLTGQLWAADVGQRQIEEIDVVVAGGNYGWRNMEGAQCYNPSQNCEREGFIDPVAQYDHTVGLSITGGYVYRGAKLPEFNGLYIYGDFANGQIFALAAVDEQEAPSPLGHETAPGLQVVEVALTNLKISSFGEDEQGELYVVDYASGGLYQFERAEEPTEMAQPLPLTLTETGCFEDVAGLVLERNLVPYEVNAQLWSDGASKERFFVLPQGEKITFTEEGPWQFPVGAILVKNFFVQAPEGRRIIETRFLVREQEKYSGYSYQWNDAQTEAFLLPGAATRTFQLQSGEALEWQYPSRSQCRACHTDASGQVLGLSTGQTNKQVEVEGQAINQIEHLAALGVFDNPPVETGALVAFEDPSDLSASVVGRARAYMHANCAHCHLPNGVATSDIDLRFATPLAETRSCGEEPKEGDLGVPGMLLIDPGVAQNSSMYRRMLLRNDEGMPPFASSVVDNLGANLVRDWINGLEACD